MKATLVFGSHESLDISIGMSYIPCICWLVGTKIISNPHRNYPRYRNGDFNDLLELPLLQRLREPDDKRVVIVIHEIRYGDQDDMDQLMTDAQDAGFTVTTVSI